LRVRRTRFAPGLRGQLIHSFDRYGFFRDDWPRRVARENDTFLSWMHVDPGMPAREYEQLQRDVPKAAPLLRAIVVTCETTRRELVKLGADPARLPVIPHGVDLETFHPPSGEQRRAARTALGIPDGALVVGSFLKDGQGWGDGNEAKPIKGPDVFLAVLERLRPDFPNLFVLLSGPARGFMKAGLARLGIPFAHRYLEEYRELRALYHALDLYLITSRGEGGPVSFPEAWAAGVPVVSTRVGMAADMIVPDENGQIADIDDTEALTALTAKMLAAAELRARCAARALEIARTLSWQAIADRHYDELYAPLLPGRAPVI
jgi:glycosyltransferase involved in cell wall biosynthesis